MRLVRLELALFIAVAFAQDATRQLLSSHDRIVGPLAGEYLVSDLQVFEDGRVIYSEESAKGFGYKPEHSTHQGSLGSEDIRRLEELLNSQDIRSLPPKVSSKTRPIDFFWQKSFEINGPDKNQEIQIENFYPFPDGLVYPKAFIELECRLQNIETEVTKRSHPKVEGNWCKATARR